MHIRIYPGLLSFNVIILLCIATKSLSNVSYDILISFCRLRVLHRFYFLNFPLFYQKQRCLLISTTFFHLYLYLFIYFFILFFFCVLNPICGLSHCDGLNSNTRYIDCMLLLCHVCFLE